MLQLSPCATNVALFTIVLLAFQHINYVVCYAGHFLHDFPCAFWINFNFVSILYVRTGCACLSTICHAPIISARILFWWWGYFGLYQEVLLKAVRGGWLKHSARYLSWVFIVLQCFAINGCIGGILGSYFIANIGRTSDFFFLTFRSAIFLGIFRAFSILLSTRLSGYFLASKSSFRSDNLLSLFSGLVQILTILRLKEYGIDFVVNFGWQLDGNKYWFAPDIQFVCHHLGNHLSGGALNHMKVCQNQWSPPGFHWSTTITIPVNRINSFLLLSSVSQLP